MRFVFTGVFLLFFAPLFSQDSLVCIKPSTARWFLEQADKVEIYQEKDSLSQQLIDNLNQTINYKDQVITTYQKDSSTYNQIIAVKDDMLRSSNKEIRKQKIQKVIILVISALSLVLSLGL